MVEALNHLSTCGAGARTASVARHAVGWAMPRIVSAAAVLVIALCLAVMGTRPVGAAEARPAVDDPALEARVMVIAEELRCLVCQNETIAASQAELARDLRAQIRQQLREGRSAEEVMDFMVARYGQFVRYRPPLQTTTWALWLGPFLLLALAAIAWVRQMRRGSPEERT